MSKKIQKIIASLVFLAGGIIFIVLGFTGMSQAKNFPEIQAKVSKIEVEEFLDENGDNRSDITVYVSYNVDGKEYNEILQDAQGELKEGDTITARYNPEKPNYITVTTVKSGAVRLAIGGVLAVAGLGGCAVAIIRKH
ncbi:MAG: DUF3592 domain-containing protein [Clostridia bacterium]|nr:DUF3592 domain-containing protein [Clostridia bacterium]